MLKRLSATFLLSCVALPSFAYTIGQQLTVTNNTDNDMQITIDKVNNQPAVTQPIPAHNTVLLYTENGDNSGLLDQLAIAPFKITKMGSNDTYAQGNIDFYVSGWYRYSYLNSVSVAEGMTVKAKYTCEGGSLGKVFQNTLILGGTPTAAPAKLDAGVGSCIGLKSSHLDDHFRFYTPKCFSDSQKSFYRKSCILTGVNANGQPTQASCTWNSTGNDISVTIGGTAAAEVMSTAPGSKITPETLKELKGLMDREIGNQYCSSFSF